MADIRVQIAPILAFRLVRYSCSVWSEIRNHNTELTINDAKIGEHTIIVVDVPEGEEKPYKPLLRNNFYVRRGANNMLANAEELRGMLGIVDNKED